MKAARETGRLSQPIAADVSPRQSRRSAPTGGGGHGIKRRSPNEAFTLTELLVVLVLVFVLAVFVLPLLNNGPRRAGLVRCMNNLRQVGVACAVWANDNGNNFPMSVSTTNGGTLELIGAGAVFPHFQVLSNELNTPKILVCPLDASRNAATNFTADFRDTRLSYFVGVDASPSNPRGLLTGDRNLTLNGQAGLSGLVALASNAPAGWVPTNLHRTRGVVGFADSSVQIGNAAQLRRFLTASGMTNRLAIP